MSKISLKPNSAGTANFEIAAPATNTDRTLTIPDDSGTLLYTDTNGDFSVNGDTFYVDASNNRVGIGTSSPAEDFGVNGSIGIEGAGNKLFIPRASDGAQTGQIFSSVDNDITIGALGSGVGYIRFEPSATSGEVMRIKENGDLFIGDISSLNLNAQRQPDPCLNFDNSSGTLTVNTINGNAPLFLNQSFDDSANRGQIFFYRNEVKVGDIRSTDSSTSYNTSSDYRLKENIVDITDGIDRLKQLPVHRFNFIADPDKTVDGFIAHEAQQVVPEAVTGEKDEVEAIGNITDSDGNIVQEDVTEPESLEEGQTWTQTGERPVYQGIDQAKIVPLLTAALQEAVEKIEQLESRIETLESK